MRVRNLQELDQVWVLFPIETARLEQVNVTAGDVKFSV
jgi:hypothetical protein